MIGGLRRCRDHTLILACALLLLLATGGASALVADAGADQSVLSDTPVVLDGSDSTGNNLTYEWSENGSVLSTQISFSHKFSIGTHEIILTVSDGNTSSDTVFVHVLNRPPVANAGADQVVSPGTSVRLDAYRSTDPDGRIASYLWEEGGVELKDVKSFRETFDSGRHEITLTVTDDLGATDTDTVVIVVNRPPVADAGEDMSVSEGMLVHFDASNSSDPDGDSLSYLWKEDGGSTLNSAQSFDVREFSCGAHRILLEVTDTYGATATDYVVIDVVPLTQEPPIANAGDDQTVLVGTSVTLNASGSTDPDGRIVKYEWLEANDTINESATFERLFPRGVHHVTLIVTDDSGASDSDNVMITVRTSMVMPEADAGGDCEALEGSEILLDASGSGGENVTYQWLANGTTLSENVSFGHVFDPGTYTVTLVVSDEYGCSDTDLINITIVASGTAGSGHRMPETPGNGGGGGGLGYLSIFAAALALVALAIGATAFMRKRQSDVPVGRLHLEPKPDRPKQKPPRQKSSKSKPAKPAKSAKQKGSGGPGGSDDQAGASERGAVPVSPASPVPPKAKAEVTVKVLDAASRTPVPGAIVHAGANTRKTDDSGTVTFEFESGKECTIMTNGIPNLYDGATASVAGNTATILLSSLVHPDQEQDARLRVIRQSFENRYREVSGYDRCIPGFYRSVAQRLIDYVRGIAASHFVRGENTPKEVMDQLIAVIAVVCMELSEIMTSKRSVDLYAACASGSGSAPVCVASQIGYDLLSDLIGDPSGFASKKDSEVQQLLSLIDNEITLRTRDMNVLPVTGVWSIAKDVLSEQSDGELGNAIRILVAGVLLKYAKEMYENPEIVKRMKQGIL